MMAVLVRFNVAFPVFVSVTVLAALVVPTTWLPNDSEMAEKVAAGARPVPVRATTCGLPVALSVMLTDAVRAPAAVGVKMTLMVQLEPTATKVPQVLVWTKSPLLVPVRVRLVMPRATLPVFMRVTFCAGLVLFTCWGPKVKLLVERLTEVAGTITETVTLRVMLPLLAKTVTG